MEKTVRTKGTRGCFLVNGSFGGVTETGNRIDSRLKRIADISDGRSLTSYTIHLVVATSFYLLIRISDAYVVAYVLKRNPRTSIICISYDDATVFSVSRKERFPVEKAETFLEVSLVERSV